ncbi:MAG: hypothetical protein ACRC33_01390 [Gemmataceae bacterium]
MAKKKKVTHPTPPAPGCGGPGEEVRPDQVQAEPEAGGPRGAVPIGLPIPLENYEALQQDAKRRKPRVPGIAQEDSGGP